MKVYPSPKKLSLLLSPIIILLALYPAYNNYKYNNHSKNWLNHDYGKNLLSSTEEYSVFMTEGGDNQVFSSLYFTYAEKLRQDLFPYDQKGNIFKRIYGDLRYVTYETLQSRSKLVNQALFMGQEPFYVDIRSQKKPYLVPYALGKPSVYLSWKLPNQSELGDFYYKNYGLMYKVQEIPYGILDYIRLIGSSQTGEVQNHLKELISRPITQEEWKKWTDKLIKEGYIRYQNNTLTFLKDYPKPFQKDPFDNFIMRWDQIENLEYYDYLSREIVISFSYERLMFLREEIQQLQKLYEIEDSEKTRTEISQEITQKWDLLTEYSDLIQKVGYDSSATLHNLGIFYLNAPQVFPFLTEDYSSLAIDLWETAIRNSPYSWSTYNILLWAYIKQSILYPEQSEEYTIAFDEVLITMTNKMMHFKSMKKDIEKAEPYQNIAPLVGMRAQLNTLSGKAFLELQEKIYTMIETPATGWDLNTVELYFSKMVNQLNFLEGTPQEKEFFTLWLSIWEKSQQFPDFFQWHISLLGELSAYTGLADPKLLLKTAQEGSAYLPSLDQIDQNNLNLFISMYRIAIATKDPDLIILYKNRLLSSAQKIMPEAQYKQFQVQVEQSF